MWSMICEPWKLCLCIVLFIIVASASHIRSRLNQLQNCAYRYVLYSSYVYIPLWSTFFFFIALIWMLCFIGIFYSSVVVETAGDIFAAVIIPFRLILSFNYCKFLHFSIFLFMVAFLGIIASCSAVYPWGTNKICNCKLQPNCWSYAATWWIQMRFHLLPNYFNPCFSSCTCKLDCSQYVKYDLWNKMFSYSSHSYDVACLNWLAFFWFWWDSGWW